MPTTYDRHQNQILYANLRRTGSIDPAKVKFDPTSGNIFSTEDGAGSPWTEQGYAWARDAVTASNRRRAINSQIAADRNSPATFFGEGSYKPGEVSYETTETGVQMPKSYKPSERKPLAPGESYRKEIYDEKTGEYKGFVSVRNPEPGEVVYGTVKNDRGQDVPISDQAAQNRRPYIAQQLAKAERDGTGIPTRVLGAMTESERGAFFANKTDSRSKAFEQTADLPGAPVQGEIERMGVAQEKASKDYKVSKAQEWEKQAAERLKRNPENNRAIVLAMIQEAIAAKGEGSSEVEQLRQRAMALGGLGPINERKIKEEDDAEADLSRKDQIVKALLSNDNAAMIRAWDHLMTPEEQGRSVAMRGKQKKPDWKDPMVQSLLFGTPKPKKKGR